MIKTELKKTTVKVLERVPNRKHAPGCIWMQQFKTLPGFGETQPLYARNLPSLREMEPGLMYEIEYRDGYQTGMVEIEALTPLIRIEGTLYRPEDAARIFLRGGRS